jgi:hypothetical protein
VDGPAVPNETTSATIAFRVCFVGLHHHVAGSHFMTDNQAAEGALERLLVAQEQGDGNGCL